MISVKRLTLLILLPLLSLAPINGFARILPAEFRLGLDAGYTSTTYSEIQPFRANLGVTDFRQTSVYAGAEILYYLISHFDVSSARNEGDLIFLGDVSYTFPVNSNLSGTSARLLRYDLRMGTTVPLGFPAFGLSFLAGFGATNMSVSTNSFGYSRLTAIQVYPVFTFYRYSNDVMIGFLSAFFKFSPTSDGTTPISADNREISYGVTFRVPAKRDISNVRQLYDKAYTLKASYVDLQHTFEVFPQVLLSSKTFTLNVGYEW